jgi:hypothetical protein
MARSEAERDCASETKRKEKDDMDRDCQHQAIRSWPTQQDER